MYRVYCFIDGAQKYRYYRTKSGIWSEWAPLAHVLPLIQAQQLAQSEDASYERIR